MPQEQPGYNAAIAVNQIGYRPESHKYAVAKDVGGTCQLIDAKSGETVYSTEAEQVHDHTNDLDVYRFDFSTVTAPGQYYVQNQNGRSYPFMIGEPLYRPLQNAVVKALYFQRCGCALLPEYAGQFTHACCHTQKTAKVAPDCTEQLPDITGGWHDAGDFGRYITPANQCIFNLLYMYELFPKAVCDDLNIPETGSGVPDLLSEARYELEWMLKMQAPSGGVYHKLCSTEFAPPHCMPEDDDFELFAAPISLQATAGFAAATAAASRIYRAFDAAFADRCLHAAKAAFAFAEAHLDDIPVDIGTVSTAPCGGGVYGDACAFDELYWASAELLRATGDPFYEQRFAHYYEQDFSKTDFGAYNQGGHGSLCYCLYEHADPALRQKVLADITAGAQQAKATSEKDGYRVALPADGYYWGSNAALTNLLGNAVSAAVLLNTDEFDDCIRFGIDYILGCNILSKCYITGFGTDSVRNPHHRPCQTDGIDEPIPGFVSGGPNAEQRPWDAEGKPPAACFIDNEWSYTTNEVTIYWNTSSAFVLGYLTNKFEA